MIKYIKKWVITMADCMTKEQRSRNMLHIKSKDIIKQALIDLKDKGIRGKIITSTYLGFNHPNVFKELLMFDNIEVRIFIGYGL